MRRKARAGIFTYSSVAIAIPLPLRRRLRFQQSFFGVMNGWPGGYAYSKVNKVEVIAKAEEQQSLLHSKPRSMELSKAVFTGKAPRGNESVIQPGNTNSDPQSTDPDLLSHKEHWSARFLKTMRCYALFTLSRNTGWLIVLLALLGWAGGVIANFMIPNRYTAEARIEVAEDKSGQFRLEQTAIGEGGVDTTKLDTQIEPLRSRTLALEVIRSLHLESNPNFTRLPEREEHGTLLGPRCGLA